MTETVEEAPPDAEVQEAESPLERRAETSSEDRPADRENYKPQAGEGRYAKTIEYKKTSKNSDSKPSANNSGGLEKVLAKALANSEAIGSEHGIDKAEVLSSILAQHLISRGDSANKLDSDEEETKKDAYDVPDGVTYLLYHQNPNTGQVYFSIETKTKGYRIAKEIGKKALHGETAQVGEFNMFNVAARGLREENPKSYNVLLNALKENGRFYDRLKTSFDGVPADTTIIEIEIKKPEDWWGKYVPDKNVEGPKSIISLDEFFRTKKSDWAFEHYDVLRGFIEKNWDRFNPQTWQYSVRK